MNYNLIISLLSFLLIISPIISKLYRLQKLPSKLGSLTRKNRNLSPKNDSYFLEQVYGNSYNLYYYYITLYFGPKKMPQTFILATASSITTSPCSYCTSCGKHLNSPYELNDDSKIIKCTTEECHSVESYYCLNNKCTFKITYSEGSKLLGFYNMQDIYFENINNSPSISSKYFSLPIGCTTNETNLFVRQEADGIMGLDNRGKSFVSLLFKNKVISKDLFSICLGDNDGYFSLGEIDTDYHKTNISYVPILSGYNKFRIKLHYMKVGEQTINTYGYDLQIDSGTSFSYFPIRVYDNIKKYFFSYLENKGYNCGKFQIFDDLGICEMFNSTIERNKAIKYYWPNISLNLEGYDYILFPENYFVEFNFNGQIGACLGLQRDNISKIIFGTTFMHGYDIIFDRDNQKIGFAEADCNRVMKNKKKGEIIIMDNDTNIDNGEQNKNNDTDSKEDDKNYNNSKLKEENNKNKTKIKEENNKNETNIKIEYNKNKTNIKEDNNKNETYIDETNNNKTNVEEEKNNSDLYMQKFKGKNKFKLVKGIIIIFSVLVVCLIVLVVFGIWKKYKTKKFSIQMDESTENKKGNNKKNINNVLELKSQSSNSNDINNV